jgi:hypothetical protein
LQPHEVAPEVANRFYTRTKAVTARWPAGVKEGVIPTMK